MCNMPAESLKEKALFGSYTHPLSLIGHSYDPLLSAIGAVFSSCELIAHIAIGDAQVVLIGDGSHGTYEFYAHRANLTKRLIEEKGFTAVAVEADWPDAFRVNRYIHGGALKNGHVKSARDSLADFERFPKWMWKNEVMPAFIEYMKRYNDSVMRDTQDPSKKVSFYGMDLYSLHRSADEVLKYIERVDPEGAKTARKKYNCFERFGEDTLRYAYETQFGLAKVKIAALRSPSDCHKEVLFNLKNLLINHRKYIEDQMPVNHDHSGHPAEEQFMAEMNALVVRDAEEYYRTMLTEDVLSWNIRDDHFARALANIADYLGTSKSNGDRNRAKIVVWAHNSHVGDAKATDMGRRRDILLNPLGEINVGQRCREMFGVNNVFNIGFLTNRGTGLSTTSFARCKVCLSFLVTAAYNWDDPPHLHRMNPPIDRSIESVFDEWATEDCFVITHKIVTASDGKTKKVKVSEELSDFLNRPRYQRFIGVIYKRTTEIPSHYSKCSVADQFDAVAHVRESRGIQPLEHEDTWKGLIKGEIDETFPFGE
ncbi:hypothetical protein A0H81_00606 [Grifola frondosa]|uniref:Erythromycin esterase n=1 Tax=Grifola frondosa TaxID=5627 RepID=A0A1C7MPP2_GRIFR|nr:hypothetical protein A0H81_00606 [Grifola frondosa]